MNEKQEHIVSGKDDQKRSAIFRAVGKHMYVHRRKMLAGIARGASYNDRGRGSIGRGNRE